MKVALAGFCSETRDLVPYDDPEFEVWTVARGYSMPFLKRVTRWFEVHPRAALPDDMLTWMMGLKDAPVYMQRHWDDIPQSVELPYRKLIEMGGLYTNSICWMIGLARSLGATNINIYGVDGWAADYGYQMAGLFSQKRAAEQEGIVVEFPGLDIDSIHVTEADEDKRLYGYEIIRLNGMVLASTRDV